jgi:cellobiose-specific phosphotransferase system component IIA
VVEAIRRLGLDYNRRMTLERMRAHLARAESELEAAQRFLDPRTVEEAEMDLVRAVANARTSLADALETIRSMSGEP